MTTKADIVRFLYSYKQIIWAIIVAPFFVVKALLCANSTIIRWKYFIYFALASDISCCFSFIFVGVISAFFEDIGIWGLLALFASLIMAAVCTVKIFEIKFILNPMKYSQKDVDRFVKIIKNILEGVYIFFSFFLTMIIAYEKVKFGDNELVRYCYFASIMIIFPRVCKYFFDVYSPHNIKNFLKE